jgi:hypothetical protein
MKGYRTIIFNVIMAGIMVLSQFGLFGDTVAPDAAAVNQGLDTLEVILTAVWGAGNLGLRAVTTTPVGKSA